VSAEIASQTRLRRERERSAQARSLHRRAWSSPAGRTATSGSAYRVEAQRRGDECVFTVVARSGARLYSFADWESAQAEAALLNRSAQI
jgi:hypothetical protein